MDEFQEISYDQKFEVELVDGKLVITNKEVIDKLVEQIKSSYPTEIIINDDFDKKEIKKMRTQVGKRRDEIKKARINIIKKFSGEFEQTCKGLEKALDDVYKKLGVALVAYENKATTTQQTYEFKVKTTDLEFVNELKSLCESKGIGYELKGE